MKLYTKHPIFIFSLFLFVCISCKQNSTNNLLIENEIAIRSMLTKHLNAVSNKDLSILKSTLSPNGTMELIQPGIEIIYTVDGFMKFHEEFFNDPNWTFKTKILSIQAGDKIAAATTEILYEEPVRNGQPYFNRLIVTYTLEKLDGEWYVIKDHASSIEKTKSTTNE